MRRACIVPVALVACIVGLLAHRAVAAEPDCRTDARFDLDATQARVVVIGEGTHGTNEGPAFVAAALCAYAKAGRPVLLAWEYPRDRQENLNAFLDSAGSDEDRQGLSTTVLRSSDGRSSLAVMAMLDTARRLRQNGHRVAVSLVDQATSDLLVPLYPDQDIYAMSSQARRQAMMASNVETRALQYPDHAIVFSTSHASRKVGDLGKGYESATLLLSRRVPVYVLGFANAGGTAWRCQGPTAQTAVCKPFDSRADGGYDDADRTIDLGVVTASPPASAHPDPIYLPPPVATSAPARTTSP